MHYIHVFRGMGKIGENYVYGIVNASFLYFVNFFRESNTFMVNFAHFLLKTHFSLELTPFNVRFAPYTVKLHSFYKDSATGWLLSVYAELAIYMPYNGG